ncbi:hypothetical protein [Flammeovirga agarivorans]|uniref:Lipoprotein n=1 Tax=Flammeovirga agarivorans TaxID=2726742 RepID=A0A7X8XTP8_9BACT|nr:hypothetical protein [Flammeovirga agarivorans]NLR89566.1 hypothetical protein [Flammeovirga agarivorans]
MKRFLIICSGLLLLGLSSCRTYKTCPTYAKSDVKNAILATEKNTMDTKN